MSNGEDLNDIHMSRLAGWLLNTIGKAMALSLLVAFIGGIVASASGESTLWFLTGIAAPLTFAFVLYNAAPPLPDE